MQDSGYCKTSATPFDSDQISTAAVMSLSTDTVMSMTPGTHASAMPPSATRRDADTMLTAMPISPGKLRTLVKCRNVEDNLETEDVITALSIEQ
ncbi:hypothetical protein COOONC_03269 [Cooperia oncophora]